MRLVFPVFGRSSPRHRRRYCQEPSRPLRENPGRVATRRYPDRSLAVNGAGHARTGPPRNPGVSPAIISTDSRGQIRWQGLARPIPYWLHPTLVR